MNDPHYDQLINVTVNVLRAIRQQRVLTVYDETTEVEMDYISDVFVRLDADKQARLLMIIADKMKMWSEMKMQLQCQAIGFELSTNEQDVANLLDHGAAAREMLRSIIFGTEATCPPSPFTTSK